MEGVYQPTVFSEGITTCPRIENCLHQPAIFFDPTVKKKHVIPSADFSISHPNSDLFPQLIETDLRHSVDEQLGRFRYCFFLLSIVSKKQ
jgi:hypothetical protein